jgi:hypothetical protein
MRSFGYTNARVSVVAAEDQELLQATPPIASYLNLDADYSAHDLHRLVLRFNRPFETGICRKISLTLRGERRGERVYLLIRNFLDEYYLLQLGEINYLGWQKITVEIPYWIEQRLPNDILRRGIRILELLIDIGNTPYTKEGLHLSFGRIGVVEDIGKTFSPNLEIMEEW